MSLCNPSSFSPFDPHSSPVHICNLNTTMSTSNEFHLFPALPPELRHNIWSFALSFPRTVAISCRPGTFQRGVPRTAKFGSIDRPPALLYVCRESRSEALRVYKPAFQAAAWQNYIFFVFF